MNSRLEQIIQYIILQKPLTKVQFDDARRKMASTLKMEQPSNHDLLPVYQNLVKKKSITRDKHIEFLLRKAQIRTLSGVAIITSLTKPYACPGQCIYCPTEAKMPKSYIASEPAAARALGLNFDPYEQMQRRIKMLEQNSHPTDKLEYIIKGGTWNVYPLKYQYWFILRSFQAANEMSRKHISTKEKFNGTMGQFNNVTIEQLQNLLNIEQNYNDKNAKHKIIGLTLETRPDAITPTTIYHMRQQGCTRIELGLQAPDDDILKLVKRGHTVQQFKDAMYLLRQAGFKVDLHFMPGLPGSTAKHDVEMYKQLFSDLGFKPDMVKIYPCTVIKNTELYQWLKDKKYKPYDEKELFDAIIHMKVNTPRYCRISRLIRDIPANEIEGGNTITNLRESLQRVMKERGLKCNCLRCREVGHASPLLSKERDRVRSLPKLFIDTYETIGGTEYFLSYEDPKRQIVFAFLRLRVPLLGKEGSGVVETSSKSTPSKLPLSKGENVLEILPEIKNCVFIRELHTYGQLISLQHKSTSAQEHNKIQHTGLGKNLVQEAETIAKKNNFKKVAVISGVGVRGYYRKLGYRKKGTYMLKTLK